MVGILRYNLFWDNTPFCTLLFVDYDNRRKAIGRELMERWERDMQSSGYGMVMTSTQILPWLIMMEQWSMKRMGTNIGWRMMGILTMLDLTMAKPL